MTAKELFFSYSHKDEKLRDKLADHLSQLRSEGFIREWHDRKIGAGNEWAGQISQHLNSADIILLLISADFLASGYCRDVELRRAMERHSAGECQVIPVILRACDWHTASFGSLQALPKDAKPITTWKNRDEAFTYVARGIRLAFSNSYTASSVATVNSAVEGSGARESTSHEPETIDVYFPRDQSKPKEKLLLGKAEVVALKDRYGVGCVIHVEQKLSWLNDYEYFVFKVLSDESRRATRKATQNDIVRFRVPIWIQGEQVPVCCGKEMFFVGKLDDDRIFEEAPSDARLWWHDSASFYVFTCSQCLFCKAIGQQF